MEKTPFWRRLAVELLVDFKWNMTNHPRIRNWFLYWRVGFRKVKDGFPCFWPYAYIRVLGIGIGAGFYWCGTSEVKRGELDDEGKEIK